MLDITQTSNRLTTFRRRFGDFMKQLKKKKGSCADSQGKAAACVPGCGSLSASAGCCRSRDTWKGSYRAWRREKRQDPAREKVFAEFEAEHGIRSLTSLPARTRPFPPLRDINATDSAAGRKWYLALLERFSA